MTRDTPSALLHINWQVQFLWVSTGCMITTG